MESPCAHKLRLCVNIDHVATIRNARGGEHPEPVRAAQVALEANADGVTAHLREDRRHISDKDISRIVNEIPLPLNLEMAPNEEMVDIALRHKPHAACIVPERREERTTEGGLKVSETMDTLYPHVQKLNEAGIRVSLFIEPDLAQLDAALRVGAPVVELHTGRYCEGGADEELERIVLAARHAEKIGLECHAGHGLTYESVGPIAAIPVIRELNIGHFLVGEAVFIGLHSAIDKMRFFMDEARRV